MHTSLVYPALLACLVLGACTQNANRSNHGSGGGGATDNRGNSGDGTEKKQPTIPVDTNPQVEGKIDESFEKNATGNLTEIPERKIVYKLPLTGSAFVGDQEAVAVTLTRKEGSSAAGCATKIEKEREDEAETILALDLSTTPTTSGGDDETAQLKAVTLRETFRFDCKAKALEIQLQDLPTGHEIQLGVSIFSPNGYVSSNATVFKALNREDGVRSIDLEPLKIDAPQTGE